jgi:hypothetical protein
MKVVTRRALPILTVATVIIFVLFIIVISQALGLRHQFDADEDFENLDRNPTVISAVPIGDVVTGVVYFESNESDYGWDYPYGNVWNNEEIYLMVLDGEGGLVQDKIPVEGLDLTYNETRSTTYYIFGTSSGVIFLYNGTPSEDGMSLLSFYIDTETTERTPSTNILPGLNITDYEVRCVKAGDTVHVVVWRVRNQNVPNGQPSAVYIRTIDGGRTWKEPVVLLDNLSRVKTAFPVARGDMLALVLLGAQDSVIGGPDLTNSLFRSTDGGATLSDRERIFGIPPPSGKESLHAGIGPDGTMLIKAWTWSEGLARTIYLIHPSGLSEAISVPVVHRYISIRLDPSETDPSQYRVDQFIGTYYEGDYYVETFDLEGNHLGTTTYDRRTAMHERIPFPTRIVDGHLQGVEVAWVGTSRGCIAMRSGEIRLVNQDPETWAKELVGRPFEVVYLHSDEKKQTHMDKVDTLIPLAWNLWLLFSIAVIAIIVTAPKPSTKPSSPRTILAILAVGSVILLTLLISASIYKAQDSYYVTEFQAFAVFFAAMGMFTVEVVARMGDRLRFTRLFHIPFGLFILLAAGDYVIWGIESRWYEDNLMILKYVLWGPLFVLVVLSIQTVTRRDDILVPKHHKLWYGPVHGLMFIMAMAMPLFILRVLYG